MLPREIKIRTGGVVDFAVAGFHDIVIFKPGFTLERGWENWCNRIGRPYYPQAMEMRAGFSAKR